jgi:hypothetical protein
MKNAASHDTKEIIDELESFESLVSKDMKKAESASEDKLDKIIDDLRMLNKLNDAIIKQNETIIKLLKKNKV